MFQVLSRISDPSLAVTIVGTALLVTCVLVSAFVSAQQIQVRRLRKLTAEFADAQQLADMGSWEWNVQGNQLTWSDHLYRIYGYEPRAILPSLELLGSRVHPEDRELVEEAVARGREDGKPFSLDHRIVRPDGAERVVHAQVQIDCDSADRPTRSLGIVRDVTERRKVENALKDSHEMLHGILDIAPEATIVADRDFKVVMFSQGASATFGYAPDEIIGSNISRLIPARFHQIHERHVAKFAAGSSTSKQMSEHGELVGLHKSGKEFPCEASLSKLMTMQGPVYTVSLRDITAQKVAKAELVATKCNLEDAQRLANVGSWEFNVERNEMICSDHLYRIYGLEPQGGSAPLEKFAERAHPDDRAFVNETIARALEAGESFVVDHRIIRPDGAERVINVQVQIECDPSGRPQRALGIAQDITDQNAARAKLISAMQAAQAANEAKSRFIANMSHELRTPLNAIIGFSEIMKGEMCGPLGSDQYRGYAEDIHKSGHHLLSLINDILSYSRLEFGKTDVNDSEIDVLELVASCRRWVAGRAIEAGVELSTDVTPSLIHLRADARLMTQILLNLLSNAVKFTPRGGKVVLSVWQREDSAIELCVRDTGIGMTSDEVARVGTPFLQLDDQLSRNFEGTGLGLSIVKKLAELQGGRLEIKSSPGEGTIAAVIMPAERTTQKTRLQDRETATTAL